MEWLRAWTKDQETTDGSHGAHSNLLRGGAVLFGFESTSVDEGVDNRGASVTHTFCRNQQWNAVAKTLTIPRLRQ